MKADEFGKYIRHLRKQAKMTIRQVETYSGVSNSYLSQLENGKRGVPSPEILRKLSDALKTPYEELMKVAGYLESTQRSPSNNPLRFPFEIDKKSLIRVIQEVTGGEPLEKKIKVDTSKLAPENLNLKQRDAEKIATLVAKMHSEDTQQNTEVVNIPVLGFIKAGYDLYADQQVIDHKPVAKTTVSDGEYFYLKVKGDSMVGDRIQEGDTVLVRRQEWVEDGKIGVVLINGDEATLKRVFYQDGTLILQSSNPNYPPRIIPVTEARIQGQVKQIVLDV